MQAANEGQDIVREEPANGQLIVNFGEGEQWTVVWGGQPYNF
jgi:hypothetical protein